MLSLRFSFTDPYMGERGTESPKQLSIWTSPGTLLAWDTSACRGERG